jgi:hypothetical protein
MAKKGQELNEGMEQENAKVVMLTDWKQIKTKNDATKVVNLEYPDGSAIGIEIYGLSKATLDALNEKYEDMKKTKPDKVFDKEIRKWVEAPKGSDAYIKWENDNKTFDSLKAAETIIIALVNKPEGETIEEQAMFLKSVLKGGQFDNLFMEILKFSGYDFNDKIEQAKNS